MNVTLKNKHLELLPYLQVRTLLLQIFKDSIKSRLLINIDFKASVERDANLYKAVFILFF